MGRGLWTGHIFGLACAESGTEYRLAKPCCPQTNSEAERSNRIVMDVTTKASTTRTLRHQGPGAFHNVAKDLKAPRWRTSFRAILNA